MKKIKYLMLALFVSFAFVLSACGEGQLGVEAQANIGNPENYTVATADDKTAFTTIVNDAEATGVTAYRMTMSMTIPGETEADNGTMKFNCIYVAGEESYEMAIKVEATYQGEKQGTKMYIKDGYMYMEYTGEEAEAMKEVLGTTKVKMPLETEGMGEMLVMLETLDLSQILAMAKDMDLSAEGVTVKVNTEGTTVRYAITEETAGTIYLVFEDGKLSSVQAEVTIVEMGSMSAKVVIEEFVGEIEYPNLEEYVDMPSIG